MAGEAKVSDGIIGEEPEEVGHCDEDREYFLSAEEGEIEDGKGEEDQEKEGDAEGLFPVGLLEDNGDGCDEEDGGKASKKRESADEAAEFEDFACPWGIF